MAKKTYIYKNLPKGHTDFLKRLRDYGKDIFELGELRREFGHIENIHEIVENLCRKELLFRIERGKYVLHDFREEFVIGNFIVKDGGIAYWSAMNYHSLTEQIPNRIFVQTSQRKRDKTIFGVRYKFVQAKEEKLVGYKTEGYGNHRFKITDVEKTIVDCFDLPKYSGGYPEIIKAFKNAGLSARKLVKYCKAINNISVVKRLAYLTELLNKPNMEYFINHALSVRNEKYNLFEYQGEKKGKTNRRWRLILNMTEAEIRNMAELYL